MNGSRATVLVVDDDLDTCRNLQDILTDLDYEVETAQDGPAALELVRQRPFDVALLDLKMPGTDGLELYREIRRLRSGTVTMIVSAFATPETTSEALSAGAWHVLSKPVDFSRLLPLIAEASQQPLVMVIDDDHDLCANLWDLLRDQGYRVCVAGDEAEAARQLVGQAFHVVLIDMKLPGGDGRSVLKRVQQLAPTARTLLITGYRDEMTELIDEALREGAEGVCYKPFDVPHLFALLGEASQRQRGAST
ncbi:MAG: response regulator [Planctomycetaceae bacterium]